MVKIEFFINFFYIFFMIIQKNDNEIDPLKMNNEIIKINQQKKRLPPIQKAFRWARLILTGDEQQFM